MECSRATFLQNSATENQTGVGVGLEWSGVERSGMLVGAAFRVF